MRKKTKLLMMLAEGFEEVEAITPSDLLRRANILITTCSISNSLNVKGGHGVIMQADQLSYQINIEEYNGIILPGGMPGTTNLGKSNYVKKFVLDIFKTHGLVAAICAAPMILSDFGILQNKSATCYCNYQASLKCGQVHPRAQVVVDDNIITSQGMGTAMAFGLTILEYLEGKKLAKSIAHNIAYSGLED